MFHESLNCEYGASSMGRTDCNNDISGPGRHSAKPVLDEHMVDVREALTELENDVVQSCD